MSNEWMIEVLSDLQRFAAMNGMPALADQLNKTMDTAMDEVLPTGAEGEARARPGAVGPHPR